MTWLATLCFLAGTIPGHCAPTADPSFTASPSQPFSVSAAAQVALGPGDLAPGHGVWLSNSRAEEIFTLAAEGKRAREGAYAISKYKWLPILATTVITAAIEVRREVRKK